MSQQVSFAGQLFPEHMAEVASRWFRSVINNRPDGEGGPEQPSSADIEAAARAAPADVLQADAIAARFLATEADGSLAQRVRDGVAQNRRRATVVAQAPA